jgi:hypothetical protein
LAAELQPVSAKPDSTTTQPTSATPALEAEGAENSLSAHELYQLTLYKWRYSLEAYGFQQNEVRELMFLKWLHVSRRVVP